MSVSPISPEQIKEFLIEEEIAESVFESCSTVFSLIMIVNQSKELVVKGEDLSNFIQRLIGA